MSKQIALIGEYTPTFEPHAATDAAIEHSCSALGIDLPAEWISTDALTPAIYSQFAGYWIAPGSPYRNLQNVLTLIQYARERGVPCLGTCGGFQHIILEYARNCLGFPAAEHAEYEPLASRLFISKLDCSLVGRSLQLSFAAGSKVAAIYGSLLATERYYCSFGVNPEYTSILKSGPLVVSGFDVEGDVRVVELPVHPFFVGTLFVPQLQSTPSKPHPLVNAFLKVVAGTGPRGSSK